MENSEATSEKKPSMLILIAGIAALTVIGAGAGWVLGGFMAPKVVEIQSISQEAQKAAEGKGDDEEIEKTPLEPNGIVQLEPITTNLAYPSTNWVRLEVALMFKGPIDVVMAEDIHQDILSYARTVSLQQLEGPRGFQYLRDDVQERVDQRSKGQISKVLFRTFVIE
jgi:flagellar FliL protein